MALKGTVRLDDATYKQALDKLRSLKDFATDALLKEVARRMPDILKDLDPLYPPQTNAPMADLWTPKQRRYFFAALREGRITVPYRRTGTLGRAIDYTVTLEGNDTAVIQATIPDNNPASKYAGFVLGDKQSRYFRQRTNWLPLSSLVREQKKDITAGVVLAIEDIVREYESA